MPESRTDEGGYNRHFILSLIEQAITAENKRQNPWIPACAGMTAVVSSLDGCEKVYGRLYAARLFSHFTGASLLPFQNPLQIRQLAYVPERAVAVPGLVFVFVALDRVEDVGVGAFFLEIVADDHHRRR